ncbi:unnamed protein product [Prunus armeniaca]|uniref:Uncharacterized protein n=1 Tax=Prunus armeniaca TaxID=36596 RepID=A0A6J5Y482_PRUAR|nr:unnamed protein product [Prunus armeniaca]
MRIITFVISFNCMDIKTIMVRLLGSNTGQEKYPCYRHNWQVTSSKPASTTNGNSSHNFSISNTGLGSSGLGGEDTTGKREENKKIRKKDHDRKQLSYVRA